MKFIANKFHYFAIILVTPLIWFSSLFIAVVFFSYVMLFVKELFSFLILKKSATASDEIEKLREEVRELSNVISFRR